MDQEIVTSSPLFYLSRFNPDNPKHCEFLATLWNTPLFISTEGKTKVTSSETAKAYIEDRFLSEYKRNGYGTYLISLKPEPSAPFEDSPLVGTVALNKGDSKESYLIPDIGYAMLPEYCGKGYATEATKLVLNYAVNELGVQGVFGFTSEGNAASARVMEKAGFEFQGIRKIACFGPNVTGPVYTLPHMQRDLSIYGFLT